MTHTRLTHNLLTRTLPAALGFFGIDVFIERTGPEWALLDFDYLKQGEGSEASEHEAWGLGLHIVVSRLPAARPAARA